MRIDGVHGYEPQRPAEQSLGRPDGLRAADADDGKAVDGSGLLAQYRPYLKAAKEGEEVDRQAVEEARQILAAGELQGPEAFRRAAEAILDRGP